MSDLWAFAEKAADYAATEQGKDTIEQTLDTHEQEIVDVVLEIQENKFVRKVSHQWDKLSPEDQQKLYEKGSQTVRWVAKRSVTLWLKSPISQLFSFLPGKIDLRKNMFDKFTPLIRIFVHLGIFSRPAWLTDEELHKNIADDAQGLKNQLRIAQVACTAVPQLRPYRSIINKVKPLVTIGAAWQEKILHAVNNAMEKDHVVAGAKSNLYKNVSTDTTKLWTQVEAEILSNEVRQAA